MTKENRTEEYVAIKTAFIGENPKVKRNRRAALKAANKYQEKFHKDICDFSYEEVCEYLKDGIQSTSASSLASYVTQLRRYREKCEENNLCTVPKEDTGWAEGLLGPSVLKTLIKPKEDRPAYVTEKKLEEIVNRCCNERSKFVLRALYEGIAGAAMMNLWELSLKDFNSDGTIQLKDGRTVKYSPKLFAAAEASAATNATVSFASDQNGRWVKWEGPSDLVMKYRHGADNNSEKNLKRRAYNEFARIKREIDIEPYEVYSMDLIQSSGWINAIIKGTKKRNTDVPTFLWSEDYTIIQNQFGFKIPVRMVRNRIIEIMNSDSAVK